MTKAVVDRLQTILSYSVHILFQLTCANIIVRTVCLKKDNKI